LLAIGLELINQEIVCEPVAMMDELAELEHSA
jgi:hypothetical protein